MDYAMNQITTTEDCDSLLEKAALDRRNLEYNKVVETHSYENVSSGTAGVDAELAGVNAMIASLEAALATLPDPASQRKFEDDLAKQNYKKRQLVSKREKYGVIGLLDKQYSMLCINRSITENDAFVDAINQRKSEIGRTP